MHAIAIAALHWCISWRFALDSMRVRRAPKSLNAVRCPGALATPIQRLFD
jgi:hypothetical protein